MKQVRKRSSEYHRRSNLKRRYNLTVEEFYKLFDAQEGCCKTCGKHKLETKQQWLVIDHCHVSKKVRGLLCNECNLALGYVKDNAVVLKNMIEYLNEAS